MSQENVEIIRRSFEAFNRHDLKALAELSHEDLEFVSVVTVEAEEATFRGPDTWASYFAAMDQTWDDWRAEDFQVLDAGDDRVVCLFRIAGRGKRSGVPVESASSANERDMTILLELDDGQARRRPGRTYPERPKPTEALMSSQRSSSTAGLYKRARQMFDPVGIGFPLMMGRDQYWPCSDAGACDPSPTQNSAPIWSVDRASWEAKGGTTIGTADPPADRKFGGEGGGTTKTTIGTLSLGKGRVVVFGALLPQPTERYEHWFGLDSYTISPAGQQLLTRALTWKRDGLRPLPASVKGYSGRTLTIRLSRSLRSATVTVRGKRQKVIRGKRLRARIDMRKLAAGRFTVKIVGRTKQGRKLRTTRHFRRCAKRR